MNLSRLLTTPLDPFREQAWQKEEDRALRGVEAARLGVTALRAAAARGEPVGERLMREEASPLLSRR